MTLTEIQRKILLAVVMQANASESEIARLLGVREHIVRRTMRMFLEKGIFIQRSAFVNPYALGLCSDAARISLPLASQKQYAKFRDILASAEESVAVIEHAGAFQLEVRTLTRSPAHLHAFYESLAQKFESPFHIHGSMKIVEQEYSGILSAELPAKTRPLMGFAPLPPGRDPVKIDASDHAILFALCNSKYLNWNQLARELSIPTTTLKYRIANLEKTGVIQGHYYVIDVKVFNHIPILIHISSKVLTERERIALKNFCRLHPKVAWMSVFLGTESAEMLARIENVDEARGIMADIAHYFGGIIDSVHMTSPLKFFKWSDYPFKRYRTLTG